MTGRIAVVTGGEGALGGAISESLREEGWQVEAPGRARLDVADPRSVERFFESVGPVDLLVNNAGITRDALATRMTEAEWDAVLDVNLRGAFLCSREMAAKSEGREGRHIVQIGSFSGCLGPAGQANYAASKSGLVGLTRALAREFGPLGIRVNCVLPGFLETPMTRDLPGGVRERALAAHWLGRFNTPGEVGAFIVALDRLKAVSGQVFQLDSRVGTVG